MPDRPAMASTRTSLFLLTGELGAVKKGTGGVQAGRELRKPTFWAQTLEEGSRVFLEFV